METLGLKWPAFSRTRTTASSTVRILLSNTTRDLYEWEGWTDGTKGREMMNTMEYGWWISSADLETGVTHALLVLDGLLY